KRHVTRPNVFRDRNGIRFRGCGGAEEETQEAKCRKHKSPNKHDTFTPDYVPCSRYAVHSGKAAISRTAPVALPQPVFHQTVLSGSSPAHLSVECAQRSIS